MEDELSTGELRRRLEHRERQIEAIRRVGEALFSHPNVEAMVRETLRIALDVLRADAGTVYLHDPEDDSLVFRYVIGGGGADLIGQKIPATSGIAGQVFKTGRSAITEDAAKDDKHNVSIDFAVNYTTQSMMTVPVRRSGADPIGVMQVLNARDIPFSQPDLEVLEVLCAQAATGIEHAQLLEEARKAEIVHVIGDISHDIKNMLTPIQTGIWTLRPMLDQLVSDLDAVAESCPPGETWGAEISRSLEGVRHDYGWLLDSAVEGADQVQARTREIADAVKGETAPPIFEYADLNETCRSVAETLRVVAASGKVEITLDLDPSLPPAELDRKQMYNALYNLVNNAIPFTPEGGTITIATRHIADPDGGEGRVLFQVRDTGRGIPRDVLESILGGNPKSTKPGGTGLGTRIVLGVMRRHNGSLTIDSEPDKGTAFTGELPLRHSVS
ncbi:MAG TPA: GAF domain-containing sensor histidine kinase [Armatimonadaceae bacterium]|nr:GAF domain-containing sensor histidine kinase [Armatimonadaceae bacterium]